MNKELPKEVLDLLTSTEKKIVRDYILKGGTPKDVASRLNVSVRTVYKALYKLRKGLKERGFSPDDFYISRGKTRIKEKNRELVTQKTKKREVIDIHTVNLKPLKMFAVPYKTT